MSENISFNSAELGAPVETSEGEQITVRAATGSAQATVTSTDPSNIS